jgi:beta-glucosidase
MERVGSFQSPVIPAERADDLAAHRALIRELGTEGAVLLKNENHTLPLARQADARVAVIGWPAVVPQIMGGGSANVNAHYRVAPLDALRAQWPDANFSHHPGADLHRYVPVCPGTMALEFYGNADLEGPVVASMLAPNGEAQWFGNVPAGVNPGAFSCRASMRYVAQADGCHAFSLISAGLSRATLNGEAVLDAWSNWRAGNTYFTFGCDEVVHRRELRAGDVVDIAVEFSSRVPASPGATFQVNAMRIGAGRELDETDISAAVEAARTADVAIVFAGLNAEWDNEGLDRPGIELPHRQNELIGRVGAANPRTVLVLQTGSPVT